MRNGENENQFEKINRAKRKRTPNRKKAE